ncbi:MAG: LTA synthase family protein [Pseudomonadota bacterium]
MITELFMLGGTLAASILLDATVYPRRRNGHLSAMRSCAGLWLHVLLVLTADGVFLSITGNSVVSAIMALAVTGLLVVVSNAKHRMLGEPLLFSDLALLGGVFRHPQFYLSALRPWQGGAIIGGLLAGLWLLWQHSIAEIAPRLTGLALLAGGLASVVISLRLRAYDSVCARPDAANDVRDHGLLATLLIYWRRWCASRDPFPASMSPTDRTAQVEATPQVVVIVQCESFADPADIFGREGETLPGLAAARAMAWQAGNLNVSGFGAYTMRTEYGVVFGRSEDQLGFRRYDPFLTAMGEVSHALPNRVRAAGWRSLFLHPHDMRFYQRDKIMPASGFVELVGQDQFMPPAPGEGRYVTDAAIADVIVAKARAAEGPTLIYAVTIENHGPWKSSAGTAGRDLAAGYLGLVRKGDAMLSRMMAELSLLRRPAMLVFFGDHRPSIPGVCMPKDERHTPYVIVRFDEQGCLLDDRQDGTDMTPAELHHTILGIMAGSDH